jgi:hypothetical protein
MPLVGSNIVDSVKFGVNNQFFRFFASIFLLGLLAFFFLSYIARWFSLYFPVTAGLVTETQYFG